MWIGNWRKVCNIVFATEFETLVVFSVYMYDSDGVFK